MAGVLAKRKLKRAQAGSFTRDADGNELDEGLIEEKLDHAFDKVDGDLSGDLDTDELMVLLREFDLELKESELETVLMLMDTDRDGRISREELKAWYLGENYAHMHHAGGQFSDAMAKYAKQEEINAMEPGEEKDLAQAMLDSSGSYSAPGPSVAGTPLMSDLKSTWEHVQTAPTGLSVVSAICGALLLLCGIMGLFDSLDNLDRDTAFVEALSNCYATLIGLLTLALEIPQLKNLSWCRDLVSQNVQMLRFVWGRGMLYTVGGLLVLIQVGVGSDLKDWFCFVGVCTFLVGVVSMGVGFRLKMKLDELKDQLASQEQIEQRFNECELDEDGELDSSQFPLFLQKFGVTLGYNELHGTIHELDADGNGKISLDEFKRWYSQRLVTLPGVFTESTASEIPGVVQQDQGGFMQGSESKEYMPTGAEAGTSTL